MAQAIDPDTGRPIGPNRPVKSSEMGRLVMSHVYRDRTVMGRTLPNTEVWDTADYKPRLYKLGGKWEVLSPWVWSLQGSLAYDKALKWAERHNKEDQSSGLHSSQSSSNGS